MQSAGWTDERLKEKMEDVAAHCKDTGFYYLKVP